MGLWDPLGWRLENKKIEKGMCWSGLAQGRETQSRKSHSESWEKHCSIVPFCLLLTKKIFLSNNIYIFLELYRKRLYCVSPSGTCCFLQNYVKTHVRFCMKLPFSLLYSILLCGHATIILSLLHGQLGSCHYFAVRTNEAASFMCYIIFLVFEHLCRWFIAYVRDKSFFISHYPHEYFLHIC